MKIIKRLVELGQNHNREDFEQLKTKLLNRIALWTIPIIGLYMTFHLVTHKNWRFLVVDCIFICAALAILFFNSQHQYEKGYWAAGIGYTISFTAIAIMIGAQNHIEYLLLVSGIGMALLFDRDVVAKRIMFVLTTICLLGLKFYFLHYPKGYMNIDFPPFFNFFNALLVFILIYIIIDNTTKNRTEYYDLLKERNIEVSNLNATLEDKVQERTSELEAQSKVLQRSNEEIKRFSYITSHDLREPLRNVMSFTQLIERDIANKTYENLKEYTGYVKFGVNRLDTITKDVAVYTEIEEKLSNVETFDCLDLLQEVLQDLPLLEEQPLTKITYQPLPFITANRELVYYIFYHIISNAIQYCDKDCPIIEVKTESFDQYHLFGIKDNGIGIDTRFYAEIFQMFRRLHNELDKTGSGIGLAICKKIVEGYHGRIWVESEKGRGATFFFTLPK